MPDELSGKGYWYDYKAGDFEYSTGPSEDDVERFLPQWLGCMGLYRLYRQMGKGMHDAMADVLVKCLPSDGNDAIECPPK